MKTQSGEVLQVVMRSPVFTAVRFVHLDGPLGPETSRLAESLGLCHYERSQTWIIETWNNGIRVVHDGDWIVKDAHGRTYLYDDADFQRIYRPAPTESQTPPLAAAAQFQYIDGPDGPKTEHFAKSLGLVWRTDPLAWTFRNGDTFEEVQPGDWIVRDPQDRLHHMTDAEFQRAYHPGVLR